MREHFDRACEFVVRKLEGPPTDDPQDPGGFTIWGLASRYNPEVRRDMTYEEAKAIYLRRYWVPAGCDDAPSPMDVVLFDGAVNPQNDPELPGAGNAEILALLADPGDWRGFLIERMARYGRRSKAVYLRGHIARCRRLYRFCIQEV